MPLNQTKPTKMICQYAEQKEEGEKQMQHLDAKLKSKKQHPYTKYTHILNTDAEMWPNT